MFIVSHRIAGLTFRTESNVRLPSLQDEPFVRFGVEDDVAPDVRHRIHKIPLDSLMLNPLVGEEREYLLQGAHVEPGALDSPLLRSPAVRAWLREGLDRPMLGLSLYPDWVVGRDFSRHVLDLFYTEEPRQDREDKVLEEWARVEDNGELEPRFRVRKVVLKPRAAEPLTGEERERFVRGIDFSPPEVVDNLLLRTPTLRSWLHASLDRSERLVTGTFMDGIMVWNQDQCTLDFFYYPEFGDTPEARAVDYFRRMFATFLPGFSALLVHSSGVIRGDQAALFLAPDEGGKTTVLRHALKGHLLNDDQVIVRYEGDEFVAHATPFGRLTSGPGQAPLGGLFVLQKARCFDLEPIRPANLVRSLWDEHQVYTSVLPKTLKVRAFDLFYDACHQVPTYRMRFPRDYVDWDTIDAAMAAG